MLSNELKSKINKLWDKFWSRGITNPITAIEQISYLLFMRRIDDAETDAKTKAEFAGVSYKTLFIRQKIDENGNPILEKKKPVYESVGLSTKSNKYGDMNFLKISFLEAINA
jgi:type I restriction enzyme M protein